MATTDITVNLKTKNNKGEVAYRLLPKTLATNVVTSSNMQFCSTAEKEAWSKKQDKIDNIDDEYINGLFGDI